MNRFNGHHILSTDSFDKKSLLFLLDISQELKERLKSEGSLSLLKGKILATLFFEPSTRTRLSFETAMIRLGGQVITVEQGDSSSIKKGESLEDMSRVVSAYCDTIVMRHPEPYSVRKFSTNASVPVINAGDGTNQHPTQSLLDLFTIRSEKTKIDGLSIGFLGDLKNGRTVHSLIHILKKFDVTLTFISHNNLKLPETYIKNLTENGIKIKETENLEEAIKELDVLYVTRVQKERFTDESEYLKVKDKYHINNKLLTMAKKDLCILHPLPRLDEISPEVDTGPNAKYFNQAQNGLYIRMAILSLILGKYKKN